jgi:hypothetical protein
MRSTHQRSEIDLCALLTTLHKLKSLAPHSTDVSTAQAGIKIIADQVAGSFFCAFDSMLESLQIHLKNT